jgi:hypothetical protein
MTVRRSLPALAAATVGALALLASGCGGSSTAIPDLTSFTTAAQQSSTSQTAKFAMTLEMAMPGVDKPLSFAVAGGFDTPARRSQLEVDLSSFAELFKSLGSSLGGTVKGDVGRPSDWKLDVIQDGDTAYVNFPLMAKQLPAGKTWVKGDAKQLSGTGGGQLGQFGSLAGTDPRDVFAFLKAVSGKIDTVGSEKIRGVDTNHYRAVIDTTKLARLVPSAQRQSLGAIDQAATQSGLTELPLDIWIDADQLVRKLSVDIDAKQPGTGKSVKGSLVVELYDYGKPLQLELPPADQVVDAASLPHATHLLGQ